MTTHLGRGSRGVWLLVLLLLGGWDLFKSPNPDVERGNQAFRDGKYDDALKAYDKAQGQGKLANEPGLRFNRGAALYQKAMNTPSGPAREELLKQAQGEFAQSSQGPDRTLRGASHYNLGNTHYQQGDYDGAVKEYKQSIKEDPSNPDARYNLELALRRREEKKQQQQQQQGQGKQDPQQQKKDQQQQQGQQQQDQKDQQQQQQQQQQGQDPKDQQQQGQDPKDQQQQQKDQQQQQGQDPKDQQQQDQQQQQGQDPKDQQQQQQKDQQQQQKDQNGQGQKDQQDAKDPKDGQDQKDPKDAKDPKDSKDQKGDAKKPGQPQRKTFGDEETKMDALERRSKDLKVQQQRGRGNARRGKVKDW